MASKKKPHKVRLISLNKVENTPNIWSSLEGLFVPFISTPF